MADKVEVKPFLHYYMWLGKVFTFFGGISFLITLPIKAFGDNYYYQNGEYPGFTIFRHLFLLLACFCFGGAFLLSKKKIIGGCLFLMMLGLSLFLLVSSLMIAWPGRVMPLDSFKAITFLFLPICLAFFVINSQTIGLINAGMKVIFWTVLGLYLFEVGPSFLEKVSYFSWDFFESYSPFESSAVAPHFYGLLVFFTFAYPNKGYFYLCVIFNILVFKRINLLAALVLFLLQGVDFRKLTVPVWLKEGAIVSFYGLTLLVFHWLHQPMELEELAQKLGFSSLQGLLMGRDQFVGALLDSGYQSAGFGSTGSALADLLGKKGLEMDLIQVRLELGWLGLLVVIQFFWRGIGRNLAEFMILGLFFLNMTTSYQLTDSYTVFYNFLALFLLADRKPEVLAHETD